MTKPTSLAAVISAASAIGALAVNYVPHAMRPAGPATVFEQGQAEGMTCGAIAFCIIGIVLALIFQSASIFIALGTVIAMAIWTGVYSYRLFQKEKKTNLDIK